MCFHAGFKTDESTWQSGNYLIVRWLTERSVRPVQIKVCICSAVPSGYWSSGSEPVQAVAEGCSVSGQSAVSSAISSAVLNCRHTGVLQVFDN